MNNETPHVVVFLGRDGQEFSRPKYWTGQMLEHWPVYLSDKSQAHPCKTKQAARETMVGFQSRGFDCRIEPA